MKKSLIIFLVYCFSHTVISCGTKDNTSDNTSTESSSYSDNGTTFIVTVNSSKYYIDGILTKSLILKKENTYYFDSTDSTTNNHPLFIGTTSSGGSYTYEYTSGVTNSRTMTATLIFVVPSDPPSKLYYNCGIHASMGGSITILWKFNFLSPDILFIPISEKINKFKNCYENKSTHPTNSL